MRVLHNLPLIVLLAYVVTAAHAADIYIVRFNALSTQDGCVSVMWHDEAMLFNGNAGPVTVKVVGVSQGQPVSGAPDSFVVPPGRAVTLDDALASSCPRLG